MKKLARFMRMYIYDTFNGLLRNKYAYILLVLLLVVGGMYYSNKSRYYNDAPGTVEYLLNYEHGLQMIEADNEKVNFELPIIYIGLAIAFSLINGNNLFGDSSYTVLVHGKSKGAWILCKNINIVLSIIFFHIVIWGLSFLYGSGSKIVNPTRIQKLLKIDMCTIDTDNRLQLLVVFFVAPVTSYIVITQIQSVVSLVFGNLAGFIAAMSIYVLSIFDLKVWMPGNGAMVQRFSYFMENGLNVTEVIFFNIIVALAAFCIQIILVRKKDWI